MYFTIHHTPAALITLKPVPGCLERELGTLGLLFGLMLYLHGPGRALTALSRL